MERPLLADVTSQRAVMSAADFDQWAQAQLDDTTYELISGEVHHVPSNPYASLLAWYISLLIGNFVLEHKLGWLTVADGGFQVGEERYAPDVAFVRAERQRRPVREGYNPLPPDLAVEIISSDTAREHELLRHKVTHYLSAGTVVLILNSVKETVELHAPGQPPLIGDATSRITFGDLLPGFTLDLQAVFAYARDQLDS
ncbi:Uma2 family endonuclease [Aggregatilineales bacterium SYSU G02658]